MSTWCWQTITQIQCQCLCNATQIHPPRQSNSKSECTPPPVQHNTSPFITSEKLKSKCTLKTTLTNATTTHPMSTFCWQSTVQVQCHCLSNIRKQMHTGNTFDHSNVNMLLTSKNTDPMPLPVQHNTDPSTTTHKFKKQMHTGDWRQLRPLQYQHGARKTGTTLTPPMPTWCAQHNSMQKLPGNVLLSQRTSLRRRKHAKAYFSVRAETKKHASCQ